LATPSTATPAETLAPPSAAHQPERIIIPNPSTDPRFNENDSVTNRVETDGQGGKFRSYFLVPDAYLYRETRSVDQPAMPQEVSHVKHGIQYGVFGQLTGVTRKPKMKDKKILKQMIFEPFLNQCFSDNMGPITNFFNSFCDINTFRRYRVIHLIMLFTSLDHIYGHIRDTYISHLHGNNTFKFSTNLLNNDHIDAFSSDIVQGMEVMDIESRVKNAILAVSDAYVQRYALGQKVNLIKEVKRLLLIEFESFQTQYSMEERRHIKACISGDSVFNLTRAPLPENFDIYFKKGSKYNMIQQKRYRRI
jgi:hypothetical protein